MSTSPDEPIAVLHVDDEPAILDVTERYLAREDRAFEVRSVESAEAALEVLETDASAIDCVVSDFRMPGTDGLEILEAVRDDHPDLPFVLFTGQGSEEIAIAPSGLASPTTSRRAPTRASTRSWPTGSRTPRPSTASSARSSEPSAGSRSSSSTRSR